MRALESADDLPRGLQAEQAPGHYRLTQDPQQRYFAWANGPQAIKPLAFAPQETLWQVRRDAAGALQFEAVLPEAPALAIIGVRACDLAALALQDAHFLREGRRDPHYAKRREQLFLVAVQCAEPAATCFCASTGDGPTPTAGYDLALSELADGFIVVAGSDKGRAVLAALNLSPATSQQIEAARQQGVAAAAAQTRRLPGRNLRDALMSQLEHPRWDAVAARCLACGNCTAVCPTCFCHAEVDAPALDGTIQPARADVGFVLRRIARPPAWLQCAARHPQPLSPVADPQARHLARPVRPQRLRRLRPLHRLVPGRHRPDRGSRRADRRGTAMSIPFSLDAGAPHAATVVARTQESPTIFTLKLRLDDAAAQAAYPLRAGPVQHAVPLWGWRGADLHHVRPGGARRHRPHHPCAGARHPGPGAAAAGRPGGAAWSLRARLAAAGSQRMRHRAGDRRTRLRAGGVGHPLRAAAARALRQAGHRPGCEARRGPDLARAVRPLGEAAGYPGAGGGERGRRHSGPGMSAA